MRIYVAAAFQDYMRARAAMASLRARAWTVTHDWTIDADKYPSGDAALSPNERKAAALADMGGVATATTLLLLTPSSHSHGCGMWFEAGAAHALGKRIVMTGPQRSRSVFCDIAAEAHFEHDADAIEYLAANTVAP